MEGLKLLATSGSPACQWAYDEIMSLRAERDKYFYTLAGAFYSGLFDKVTVKELREPGERLQAKMEKMEKLNGALVEVLALAKAWTLAWDARISPGSLDHFRKLEQKLLNFAKEAQ